MASESSDEGVLSVAVPAELDEWLDVKAADLGVQRETLVVQLLAAYHTAEELDDETLDLAALFESGTSRDQLESAVRDVVADRIPDIAGAVEEELDGDGADVAAVEDRLQTELDRLERDLEDAETSFQDKLQDVRERVIQVKKEADAKAPEDHSHPELDDVATIRAQLEELESTVDDYGERMSDIEADVDELGDVESRLDDAEEKLDTIAWVVSDLREAHEAAQSGTRAIDRLKRRAAKEDVDRAVCDNCEQPVDIALLSEAKCPHCQATVNDVRLPGGLFGKPRLAVAQQLEAGDDQDGDSSVPDAARR
jgi:chromosome segregation ATPase